jgi:maltooligosyltrehalose trehalohydrolase
VERPLFLIAESDLNDPRLITPREEGGFGLHAQWNDDFHHALHVALTGEDAGYYADYADAPVRHLGRCLAEGFAHQNEPSADLSPTSFVSFIQNHDQVGNRAFGERISHLAPPEAARAAAEIYLLAPQVPMLFMGEEWGARTPFPFFCDFEPDLAPLVTEGRREEFARFPEFSDPATRDRIPDPGAEETFRMAVLDWESLQDPEHAGWLELYGSLLALRGEILSPRLGDVPGGEASYRLVGERGLSARWTLGDGSLLTLLANLGPEPLDGFERPPGEPLYASEGVVGDGPELPAWSVAWYLRGSG